MTLKGTVLVEGVRVKALTSGFKEEGRKELEARKQRIQEHLLPNKGESRLGNERAKLGGWVLKGNFVVAAVVHLRWSLLKHV